MLREVESPVVSPRGRILERLQTLSALKVPAVLSRERQ